MSRLCLAPPTRVGSNASHLPLYDSGPHTDGHSSRSILHSQRGSSTPICGVQSTFDPIGYQMVDPGEGTGAFFTLLPNGSIGCDLDPKHPGLEKADFLALDIRSDRKIAVIGNPPFGRNASMAVRFFNHAACRAKIIEFILPRSFRKASVQNRLNRSFHLLCEEEVPANAFLFRSKPYDVPAVFQIWERRAELRGVRKAATSHPDFEFTSPCRADFAIQRVGARAGRVHQDFTRSASSHYFIRGQVRTAMTELAFRNVVGNVAGNPSLSKAEIVQLYCEWRERNCV